MKLCCILVLYIYHIVLIPPLFHEHGIRRGLGVSITPWPLFTPGKGLLPIERRLDGPQGQSGHVRKFSPPPAFDPRTVQLVARRYTGYATRPILNSAHRILAIQVVSLTPCPERIKRRPNFQPHFKMFYVS
jgi:hypothetical protein